MNEDCNKGVWRLQTQRMEAPNGRGLGTYACSSTRKNSVYRSRINLINYLFAPIRANLI